MKTTVDLPESLLREVHRVARQEGATFKSFLEDALRAALARHEEESSFTLRDQSFAGEGLQPEFQGATWGQIRDAIYDVRP